MGIEFGRQILEADARRSAQEQRERRARRDAEERIEADHDVLACQSRRIAHLEMQVQGLLLWQVEAAEDIKALQQTVGRLLRAAQRREGEL